LSSLAGNGHASFQERTATGVNQSTSSDTLDVRFNVPPQSSSKSPTQSVSKISAGSGTSDIASMVQTGHVVMTQDQPPQQPGKSNGGKSNGSLSASQSSAQAGIRATANRADYDGKAQILHLSESPRIEDGALDMTANLIDFNRSTSDAFAHGDVKASWSGLSGQDSQLPGAGLLGSGGLSPDSQRPDSQKGGSQRPGGNAPAHAIAAEAELRQATQEVIFRGAAPGPRYSSSRKGQNGNQARLWQAANSVMAPVIILNRQKQTLDAEATGPANPVVTVLVTNSPANSRTANLKAEGSVAGNSAKSGGTPDKKPDSPSVIRLRSGQLHYSEGERLALFHSGVLGSVKAETTGPDGASTVVSQEAEVKLLPAGTRSPKLAPQNAAASPNTNGPANPSANSSIDRLTARGGVTVDWPDRKGTGDKLVYLSEDGTFTLTGTSSTPPRITDQYRGTVTGAALIFDSRSDSVTVEGDGGKTVTDTQTTKKRAVLN
jgi:lipopolysaccharide export system protein LptA